MFKSLILRIKNPNKKVFEQYSGCCRFIYNKVLEKNIEKYKLSKTSYSLQSLFDEYYQIIKDPEYQFLSQIDEFTLEHTVKNLHNGFIRFFNKTSKYPKFKSKKQSRTSFKLINKEDNIINLVNNNLSLGKLGNFKVFGKSKHLSNITNCIIYSCTIYKDSDSNWYCSLLLKFNDNQVKKLKSTGQVTGIDVGISNDFTFSNGFVVSYPEILTKETLKLKRLQKSLAQKTKGSNNREKIRIKLAKQFFRIKSLKKSFLQDLTFKIVDNCDIIVIETLNIKNMLKRKSLARSISERNWNRFSDYLEYKCNWYKKVLIKVPWNFPSSKLCSCCGKKNKTLTLSDRVWICPICNIKHDRDFNAAKNLELVGLGLKETGEVIKTEKSFREFLSKR